MAEARVSTEAAAEPLTSPAAGVPTRAERFAAAVAAYGAALDQPEDFDGRRRALDRAARALAAVAWNLAPQIMAGL